MKYKLKKDTPYHKAGEELELSDDNRLLLGEKDGYCIENIQDFDEWFEKITFSSQDMKAFAFKCVEYYFPQAMAGFDHHDRNEQISKLLEGFKK
jgi:hypothetical protein